MRTGICITLKPADRRRLATLARDRNAPHKHVWRAEIVLLSADGIGTNEIMRRTGKSKTCVSRWQERFMCFLNAIEAQVPAGKLVHVILDNYAVHKHPKVRQWLARHPRSAFHFTPTSCSWLNAVEGFFAQLAKQRLKRGVFRAWSISKPPSPALSPRPTMTPNPSPGPPIQTKSSPLSGVGTKC
jgi:DDE superfamily endonuclease/Homeodomain-like domain-containing protein